MREIETLPLSRKIIVIHCEAALKGKQLEDFKNRFKEIGWMNIPCTGRLNPIITFKALMDGAGGVIVYGCPTSDCHNFDGNLFARRRFHATRTVAEALGVDPERIVYIQKDPLDAHLLGREITAMRRFLDKKEVKE